MAFPNPSNLQIRTGTEGTEGAGNVTNWTDVRVLSESLGGSFPQLRDESIIAQAEWPVSLPTRIDPNGDLNVNLNAEDHAKFIAQFFKKYANPSTVESGVYKHKLSISQANSYPTLAIEVYRDITTGAAAGTDLYKGVYCSGFDLSVNGGKLTSSKFSFLIPRYDMWATATQTGGTGTGNVPFVRGILNYTLLSDSTKTPLSIKVTTAPTGSPLAMGVKCDIVGSPTYPGAEITGIQAGVWYDAQIDTGELGDNSEPVQFMFPSLASILLNDVFQAATTRAKWSQSLATAAPMNGIDALITVDGVAPFRAADLTLSVNRPVVKDDIIGGRWQDTVVEFGKRNYTLTIKRRTLDRSLWNKLIWASTFKFELIMKGPKIATSEASRRSIRFIANDCRPYGKAPSVSNSTTFDETITATMHPNSVDGSYPDGLTCEIVNSMASLAS